MQKKISLWLSILLAVLLCTGTFLATYSYLSNQYEIKIKNQLSSNTAQSSSSVSDTDSSLTDNNNENVNTQSAFMTKLANKLKEVDDIFRALYINEIDDDKLIDYTIAGYIAGTGDDYAAYYNAEDFQTFLEDMEGEMTGIGVNVIYNSEYKLIEVINVLEGSPAEEAGIQPGDLFYSIGQGEDKVYVAEIGYYPAIDLIRGTEGSYVYFSILRGEKLEEINFTCERRTIIAQSVMYHVYDLDSSVGVIKISGFEDPTCSQFVNAVEELKKLGCDKFVFDLRYNPGGELNSIVTTLDYILPSGPIVRIMDAEGEMVKAYYSEASELNAPMAVLVNGSTASAAELFTSALRDYNKAIIVGTKTYGKGCMQTTLKLSDNSAVSVTYRMYNPPYSDNYHGIGIVPDVIVELDENLLSKSIYKVTDEEDNQLAAAVTALYDSINN